ncbi:MAG: ribose-phosphate pyrophosphokinase-like domain-containing protein, partial [Bdellovibrionales bacterium]|nr:ribose-phosphate pyrophosphokinase-like domain-containing protein [Bdellovibrionales bacterium]
MSAGMAPRDGNGGEVEGPVVPPGRLEAQEPIDLTQVTTMPTSHATGGKGPREILPFDPDKKAKNITLKELALRTTRGLFPHGPDGASPEVRKEANKQLEALVREILPEEKIQGRVPRFLADGQARFFLPEDATKLDRQVRKRAEQIDEIRREFDAKPDWVQERIRDLMEPYKVFTLPQSIDIGRRTMNRLGGELANHNYQGFADGNSRVDLEDVSGYKCVLIAGQSGDPDAASMDIARYLSAMKNSGASEVILILTYYSSRLDRTDSGRTHIDLKLHAKEFERAGADFVIPIEPHCEHAELAFDRRYLPLRGSTIGLRAI